MPRFLRTDDDNVLVNADRIDRIVQSRATLSDGTSVMLANGDDDLERLLAPVVAAAPGYVRLRYHSGMLELGVPAQVERMPVVAWQITEDAAYPIVPGNEIGRPYFIREAVLLPDGRVVEVFEETFDDEKAWLAKLEQLAAFNRKLVEPTPRKDEPCPFCNNPGG